MTTRTAALDAKPRSRPGGGSQRVGKAVREEVIAILIESAAGSLSDFEPYSPIRRSLEATAWNTTATYWHTFASNLLTAGTPIFTVSKWLGHSSIEITVNRYGHLIPREGEHDEVDRFAEEN